MTAPAPAAVVICRCGHGQRLHPAKDDPPVRLATIHPLRRRTA
jgi:hypothetical protein